MRRAALVAAVVLGWAAPALPARADEATDKREAGTLFTEGNRLLQQGDYAGALNLYRSAYDKFKSPKILLNMGAALRQLDRPTEALDTYERYLADPGADPKRRKEVEGVVRDLEKTVARLEIKLDEPGATLTVDGAGVAGNAPLRVKSGSHTIGARKPGFDPWSQTVTVAAGEHRTVTVAMSPVATTTPVADREPSGARAADPALTTVTAAVGEGSHSGRFGGVARLDVDVTGGLAALIGATVGVGPSVELVAAAVLGPAMGAYAGGAVMFGHGALRPRLAVGMPILFLDSGAAPGIHAAAGLQWNLRRALSVSLEVGVQHFPTLDDKVYLKTLFIPSLGLQAWL